MHLLHYFYQKELPLEVYVYGKNDTFTDDINDGTLLAEGARPGAGGVGISWDFPSSNPLFLYGIGDLGNLNRTSSIPETSLTSSFRYYRVRYSGSIIPSEERKGHTYISIAEVTPVTRSFVSSGTSAEISNGVLNVNTIVTNNLIGTASFAHLANVASSSISASYALTASVLENPVVANPGSGGDNLVNITIDGISYTIPSSTPGGDVDFGNVPTNLKPNINADGVGSGLSIGASDRKWKEIFAIDTFFGGIHEINLKTEGLDKLQEGTVLTLKNGVMCPCEKEEDPLVMGIVSKGKDYPIILGAEPVLITGKVEEGDYIITSNVKGHGKGVNPQHIYSKQLFGKIIAQAIESGEGESYTIKAMIRKM